MTRMKRFPIPVAMACLAAAAFVVGCSAKPRPPVYSLYGFQRLAVVPFDNVSRDPALAGEVTDGVEYQLVRLKAAPVVEGTQVAPYLATLGTDPAVVSSEPELLKKLGTKFKSDVLMTGSVDSYEEVREFTEPRRVVKDSKTGAAEWGFYLNRRVTVKATAKLFDPSTGSLLWTQRSSGYSYLNDWHVLPIPGSVKVPMMGAIESAYKLAKYELERGQGRRGRKTGPREERLLYTWDGTFADLRQKAVASAVSYLTSDFWGRGGWTPTLQGKP